MASKTAYYVQLAEDTRHQITGSMDGWKGFLTTAARNYKYTYPEQLILKDGELEDNWNTWVEEKMAVVQPVLDQLNK